MRSELCVRVIRVFPDRIPPARPDLAGAVRFGGEGVPGSERRGGAPAATRTPRGRSRRGGSSWMRRRPEEEATRARVIKRTKERQRGRREREAQCVPASYFNQIRRKIVWAHRFKSKFSRCVCNCSHSRVLPIVNNF
jgi:hypothetical protein